MIFLKIIISLFVISFITIFHNLINTKKNHRSRQVFLPIADFILAVLFVIIAINFMDYIQIVTNLWDFFNQGDILAINIFVMLAMTISKLLICPVFSKLCKKQELLESTANAFYFYDSDYDEWFLKKKWSIYRQVVLSMLVGLVVSSGIFYGLTWSLGNESIVWFMAFPSIAVVILCDFYSFINGYTKEEFEHDVFGEDSESRRVSNYYKVREVLENIIPQPLLSAHSGFEFANKKSPLELMKKYEISKDRADNIVFKYFDINNRYFNADADNIEACSKLMHRKNVVFFNPFYKDLSLYLTLPIINTLMSGKKCLVITGSRAICDDVSCWLSEIISDYTRVNSLWKVKVLSEKEPNCEIGIINGSQLYDERVFSSNKEFFYDTDFVLMIEPSQIINTGQIALNVISQEMEANGNKPVYCICNRVVSGLVDTLSHVLHSEFTDVIASPVPRCSYTGMTWNVDGDFKRQQLFDKETKYLGNGIELAAIAIKNQVPKVSWYCETKAPIRDIKWISGQNYHTICRYINLPTQQQTITEKIEFIPNLWSGTQSKEKFIIVEDEFCNMFSTLRAFLSRGKAQSFINVMSENYLLRDYMRCNKQLFLSNPDAIPSIVPDYSKSERNTFIKLLLQMTFRSVCEKEIIDEFHLVGIDCDDTFALLTQMLKKYTFVDSSIFNIRSIRINIDELTAVSTLEYTISRENFDEYFSDSLKNAYFIIENEKHYTEYVDAKLFNHITQVVLPGQFLIYDGKYYLAKYVTPKSGVVLRRASGLFENRKYYRQIRKYYFEAIDELILSTKKIMDIEISVVFKNFNVETSGYLEMNDLHDLKSARLVDFSLDPSIDNYKRSYRNKRVLQLKLPDSNENVLFTLCLLIAETFKTIFPDGWPYLAVVTKISKDIEGYLNYMIYPISGNIKDGYIYVIEDSDMDLGLLEAVERNLLKIFEIVTDFVDWHISKMCEPAREDPQPKPIEILSKEEEKKKNLLEKMFRRIRQLFTKEVANDDSGDMESNLDDVSNQIESETETDDTQSENTDYVLNEDDTDIENVLVNTTGEGNDYSLFSEDNEETLLNTEDNRESSMGKIVKDDISKFDAEIVNVDGTDIFENDGFPEHNEYFEDQFKLMGLSAITKSRYQEECFLKFGFDEIDGRLQLDDLYKYMRVRGWTNNDLTKSRTRDSIIKDEIKLDSVNHCDFCGVPLNGVSYDLLNDGRVRCNDCSNSAISTIEDFKTLYYQVLGMLEPFFGIKFKVPLSIGTADARIIAKKTNCVFKPSTEFTSRVLGFAQKKGSRYSLLIENGSPRLATIDTMVHELTHIWQYLNWDDSKILEIYRMPNKKCTLIARDVIYEGMAMWASIQYLYLIGELHYAEQQELIAVNRKDVYGMGFRLYREQFPLIKDSGLVKYSPFGVFPVIDPEKLHEEIKKECSSKYCVC